MGYWRNEWKKEGFGSFFSTELQREETEEEGDEVGFSRGHIKLSLGFTYGMKVGAMTWRMRPQHRGGGGRDTQNFDLCRSTPCFLPLISSLIRVPITTIYFIILSKIPKF